MQEGLNTFRERSSPLKHLYRRLAASFSSPTIPVSIHPLLLGLLTRRYLSMRVLIAQGKEALAEENDAYPGYLFCFPATDDICISRKKEARPGSASHFWLIDISATSEINYGTIILLDNAARVSVTRQHVLPITFFYPVRAPGKDSEQ